jgi:hypothetical protein
LDSGLAAIKLSSSTILIVQPSPLTFGKRGRIIAAAMKNGLGTVFGFPVAAREGALVGYGPDYLYTNETAAGELISGGDSRKAAIGRSCSKAMVVQDD